MRIGDPAEYQLRRQHENELFRQHNNQERSRAERVVYLAGLVPLTTLSLAELQWYPGVLLTCSIVLSIFAYGHWYVNEYHGACWRIYDARKNAYLVDPERIAVPDDDSVVAGFDQEIGKHSRAANRTVTAVILHLMLSFGITAFALLDQYLDLPFLPSPPQSIVAITICFVSPALILWLSLELRAMLKAGWPTSTT